MKEEILQLTRCVGGNIQFLSENFRIPDLDPVGKTYIIQGDIFSESIPDNFIYDVWNMMWRNPLHKFRISTENMLRAREWIDKNASRETGALPGEILTNEQLYYNNVCGYAESGDDDSECNCNNCYMCGYPFPHNSEEICEHGRRICFSWACPIATDEVQKKYFIEQQIDISEVEFDEEGYSTSDSDENPHMQIYSRPGGEKVTNVFLESEGK